MMIMLMMTMLMLMMMMIMMMMMKIMMMMVMMMMVIMRMMMIMVMLMMMTLLILMMMVMLMQIMTLMVMLMQIMTMMVMLVQLMTMMMMMMMMPMQIMTMIMLPIVIIMITLMMMTLLLLLMMMMMMMMISNIMIMLMMIMMMIVVFHFWTSSFHGQKRCQSGCVSFRDSKHKFWEPPSKTTCFLNFQGRKTKTPWLFWPLALHFIVVMVSQPIKKSRSKDKAPAVVFIGGSALNMTLGFGHGWSLLALLFLTARNKVSLLAQMILYGLFIDALCHMALNFVIMVSQPIEYWKRFRLFFHCQNMTNESAVSSIKKLDAGYPESNEDS